MKKIMMTLMILMIVALFAVSCGSESAVTTENTTNTTEITTKETVMTTQPETTTAVTTTTAAPVTTTAPVTTEDNTPKVYPLEGKTFMFLGSSVTYGSASGGTSFVEFIQSQGKCNVIKEAVSGTTLVDNGDSSYVKRFTNNLVANYKDTKVDHLIVQLSTNDASQNKPLGKVIKSTSVTAMNTATIVGAIEYIVALAKETWDCEVSFYTGTKYESSLYGRMVEALYDVQEKWGIGIIDLWNDEEMNAVSASDYARYMSDSIHPTLLGYRVWWTPKFIAHLEQYK